MEKFDILEYIAGLTGYNFDLSVIKRIAADRHVLDVSSYEELDKQTRDLLYADILYTAYLSPSSSSSISQSHGSFSRKIGSQSITDKEKERLRNTFISIYNKYDKEKLEEIEIGSGTIQWLKL